MIFYITMFKTSLNNVNTQIDKLRSYLMKLIELLKKAIDFISNIVKQLE